MDGQPPNADQGAFDESGGLDLRMVWDAVRKWKWLILAITVIATVVVGLWSLRLPKVYAATTRLEFDPSPPRPLGEEINDVTDSTSSYLMSRAWLETQYKIISSRQVCEAVVRETGLHHDAEFFGIPMERRDSWTGASVEHAAKMLCGRISVHQVEETRLVDIRVTGSNPHRTAMLANAVAKAYIEKTQRDRLGSTLDALDWLSTQLDQLTKELNEAELKLHEFKEENNVLSVALEDRINVVAKDIEQLSTQLTNAKMRRIRLEAQLQSLRELQESDPLAANIAFMEKNPALANMRNEYRTAMAERGRLSTKYGENHPQIQSLDAKIRTVKEQINEEIQSMLGALQGDLQEAAVEEAGLAEALEEVNQKALELNLQEIQYDRLHRQRDNKAKLQGLLLERTAETNLTRMLQVKNVRVLDRALPAHHAIKPNVRQNVAFGMLGGLMFGLLLAIGLGFLDRTVKQQTDVEALGVGFLGIVPVIDEAAERRRPIYGRRRRHKAKEAAPETQQDRDLIVHKKPMSSTAECTRVIRTNLTFMSADRSTRSMVVTSSGPQEGKTTIATNLAIVVAQAGRRVLLVDTDLRRPRLHRVFGVPSDRGVSSYLVSEAGLLDVAQVTSVPNLSVLPCGPIPPNPSELMHTERFTELVEEAKANFDLVIFDSPPLAAVTDAAIIGPQVDGTVVVARVSKTQKDMLGTTVRQLRTVGARLLGCVLNAVDMEKHGSRYYYYRGGYYAADRDESEGKREDAEAA